MSMSTGPAAAIVAASGFIWSMNGQRVVATPTVASDPVARNKKSRFVTEWPPWPVEAVSELIVMQRVSKRTSGFGIPNHRRRMNSTARAPFVYPPPSPLATPRSPRTLVVLGFPRRFDDDPAGVEIDAQRNGFCEREKQGFPPVGRRDLENVPSAMVHERYDPADRRPCCVNGFQSYQVVVVEFVLAGRRQLVAASEDFHVLQRLGRLTSRNPGDARHQHVVLERPEGFERERSRTALVGQRPIDADRARFASQRFDANFPAHPLRRAEYAHKSEAVGRAKVALAFSARRSRRGFFGCGRSSGGALLRLLLRQRLLRIVVRFALGEAKAVEQAQPAFGRLRAFGEPCLGLLLIEHDAAGVVLGLQRIEGADLFDKATVARHARVGDHNAIEGALLCAAAGEADFH